MAKPAFFKGFLRPVGSEIGNQSKVVVSKLYVIRYFSFSFYFNNVQNKNNLEVL